MADSVAKATKVMPRALGVSLRGRAAGFTMIELLLVLAVVGVLTSIAAPAFSPGKWRADAGVQELMASLSATQRLAVLQQHDFAITVLETERALEVHRDADNDGVVDTGEDVRRISLPEAIGFGAGGAPTLNGDPTGTTASFTDPGAGPRLVFHRNGAASEAGRIYLHPLEGSMSSAPEATRALEITRSTGEIRCFSYRSGAWEDLC